MPKFPTAANLYSIEKKEVSSHVLTVISIWKRGLRHITRHSESKSTIGIPVLMRKPADELAGSRQGNRGRLNDFDLGLGAKLLG